MFWFGFLNSAWLIVVATIQLVWIDQLPAMWPKPNLLLISLIIWLVMRGWQRISYWVLAVGVILDCLSFYQFGGQTVLWLTTIGLANLLLVNFFTNKSLYAFSGLVVVATIGQWFGLALLSQEWFSHGWWLRLGGQVLANWLLMMVLYYLIYWLDKRLNPLFLWKRS